MMQNCLAWLVVNVQNGVVDHFAKKSKRRKALKIGGLNRHGTVQAGIYRVPVCFRAEIQEIFEGFSGEKMPKSTAGKNKKAK